jgi:hypothetical protein
MLSALIAIGRLRFATPLPLRAKRGKMKTPDCGIDAASASRVMRRWIRDAADDGMIRFRYAYN